jgi:hypothetical protein
MRNLFLLIFTLGITSVISAQEPTSFYFTAPQPSGVKNLEQIPQEFTGKYKDPNDPLKSVIITRDSIYTQLITPILTTRSELASIPGITLGDSLLFGIYQDRGVPYFSSNDTIIYFMDDKYVFFKPGEKQVMRMNGDDLLLSYKDPNGNWSVLMITKEEDESISISEIDHEQEMDLIIMNRKWISSGSKKESKEKRSVEWRPIFLQ